MAGSLVLGTGSLVLGAGSLVLGTVANWSWELLAGCGWRIAWSWDLLVFIAVSGWKVRSYDLTADSWVPENCDCCWMKAV